ncbi:GNAT family N-acetyltransferase [Bacteroidota bacterium]
MLKIFKINSDNDLLKHGLARKNLVDFLFSHLDKFGDPKEDINRCIDYSFSKKDGMGGFSVVAFNDDELIGALVMNKTGMSGYIPDNILVYVAVHAKTRGKGFGRQIIEQAHQWADGDVKLHVEYDNPAKNLYERIGYTNKYAEMRFIKK